MASVETDNYEGMCLAVARLKELGHQTIGYLGGLPLSYIFQQRQSAFFSAMRTCGLPVDKSFSGTAHRTSVCLETHFQRLRDKGCTAIICSHDLLANALLVHCRENGLSVPRDLSVIGMDDIPLSQHTDPPLTTIRQNRLELGRCAYYAMSSLLSGVPVSRLLLHTELVERGSIGPAGGQRTGTSDCFCCDGNRNASAAAEAFHVIELWRELIPGVQQKSAGEKRLIRWPDGKTRFSTRDGHLPS